jgi:hypothetical protein
MPHTIESALQDDLVTVLDRHDDMGSFAINIGMLDTPVFIELGRFLTDDRIKFSVSHSIHTPLQAGPYRTSISFRDDPGYTLHLAISGLTEHYRQAVRAGHTPDESWLVRN